MADQSKPEGNSRENSESKPYGVRAMGGGGGGRSGGNGQGGRGQGGSREGGSKQDTGWQSNCSSGKNVGFQRKKRDAGSYYRRSRGFWGYRGRGYEAAGAYRAPGFLREARYDTNEGQKQDGRRGRYYSQAYQFRGERWWNRGGKRIHVALKKGELERGAAQRASTSNTNPPLVPPIKQWFKVTIPNGKKYDKTQLLKMIQDQCKVPFNPIEFHYEQNKAHFLVGDSLTPSALKELNGNIIDPDNQQMPILISSSGPPYSVQNELKPDQVEQLKLIMSKKYNSSQNSLDLKGIRLDPDLMTQHIDLILNRKTYMSVTLKIIGENIPQLFSLNLSNNRLNNLDDFSEIVSKAPNLKILNLSGNELKTERELDKIKELKLEELWLKGNPLCNIFQNHSSYLTAIRQCFPNLCRLDGRELPPPIASDVKRLTALPTSQGSYFGSDTMKGLVMYFLQQYYAIYDTGPRQGLLEAYHERACCSLTFPTSLQNISRYNLNKYLKHNRNIKTIKHTNHRFSLLKHSHLAVVAFLNELPKTQHDLNSFVVDVSAQTETLLCFTVNGIFKEKHDKSPDIIRAFTRVFIAIPANNATRMCMINDELFIRNARPQEIRKAFATPSPPTVSSTACLQATLSQEQKLMIQSFSTQSGMNPEWSQKCLLDNNWDFAQAAQIFIQFKAQKKIPAAAFEK